MPKSVLFDREEVLTKVMKLFWQKGYNGTSMQDLVDTTGLNRSSLYNTFGDKFQLYMDALKHYQLGQNDMLSNACENSKSAKASLRCLFTNISESVSQGDHKGCFLTNCTSELSDNQPEVRTFLVDNKESIIKLFTNLIKKGQASGELKSKEDPEHLAFYLFSTVQGLRLSSMLSQDSAEIEAVTNHVFNTL